MLEGLLQQTSNHMILKDLWRKKFNDRKDLLLKGSWYILNLPTPYLTNVTITVNSAKDLNEMVNKLIAFSK